jgi:hypothetical protein
MINVDEYPNLSLIAWNRQRRLITEEEALALYEANWRWVDVMNLIPEEQALIDRLVRDHGNGVLLV